MSSVATTVVLMGLAASFAKPQTTNNPNQSKTSSRYKTGDRQNRKAESTKQVAQRNLGITKGARGDISNSDKITLANKRVVKQGNDIPVRIRSKYFHKTKAEKKRERDIQRHEKKLRQKLRNEERDQKYAYRQYELNDSNDHIQFNPFRFTPEGVDPAPQDVPLFDDEYSFDTFLDDQYHSYVENNPDDRNDHIFNNFISYLWKEYQYEINLRNDDSTLCNLNDYKNFIQNQYNTFVDLYSDDSSSEDVHVGWYDSWNKEDFSQLEQFKDFLLEQLQIFAKKGMSVEDMEAENERLTAMLKEDELKDLKHFVQSSLDEEHLADDSDGVEFDAEYLFGGGMEDESLDQEIFEHILLYKEYVPLYKKHLANLRHGVEFDAEYLFGGGLEAEKHVHDQEEILPVKTLSDLEQESSLVKVNKKDDTCSDYDESEGNFSVDSDDEVEWTPREKEVNTFRYKGKYYPYE